MMELKIHLFIVVRFLFIEVCERAFTNLDDVIFIVNVDHLMNRRVQDCVNVGFPAGQGTWIQVFSIIG